jgi:hypothetical protein
MNNSDGCIWHKAVDYGTVACCSSKRISPPTLQHIKIKSIAEPIKLRNPVNIPCLLSAIAIDI